jgi:putative transposase
MRKRRFSVEQMIGVLKQAEVGVPVAEVIRKAGISEQTFYRWKAKYAGLEGDWFARWHSYKRRTCV